MGSLTSKLITLAPDGNTAVVTDANVTDILTTMISTNTFVSGSYGLIQKVGTFAAGMALQNNRLGRGWNPLSAT